MLAGTSARSATFRPLLNTTIQLVDKLIVVLEASAATRAPATHHAVASLHADASPPLASPQTASLTKKPTPKQSKAKSGKGAALTPTEQFHMAKLQVSRLGEVTQPEGTKLFKSPVDIGGGESKQLMTGLVGQYSADELSNRLVVTIVNLKAAKLAGFVSEVMLLAGSEGETVKILEPPAGSSVGDTLFLEGGECPESFPEQINKKQWDKVVALLSASGGYGSYNGCRLVTKQGPVACPLPDGSEIH